MPRRHRLIIVSCALVAGAVGAPATVASAGGAGCPAGTGDAVTAAFGDVFSRVADVSADDRAARLQGGDDPALAALLDRWLADPAGRNTSVTVVDVRCRSPRRAAVTSQLLLSATPLSKVLAQSRAVREDGTWKVARATFCTRMILEDPALASAGPCRR